MELDDAIHTALLTLRESYDGEMTENNIEVGIISAEDKTFRVLTAAEVKDFLDEFDKIDIDDISPRQSLDFLYKLKSKRQSNGNS